MRKLIFVLVIALSALSALAQQGSFAEPAGAELNLFPIKLAPLTLAEQAELGLSAKKLEKPVVVQNHFRNIRSGRFVLETLPAGTLVLVDNSGTLRYKADCGNRIVEIKSCPQCPPQPDSGKVEATKNSFRDWLKRGWEGMGQLLGLTLGALLPFLTLIALLTLLILLGYGLYRLFQGWREDGGNNPPSPIYPRPAPIAPAPLPVAPNPTPVVPAPAPAPPTPVLTPEPVAPIRVVPPPPAPASGFPSRRAIVDFGGRGNATRIQSGDQIPRVEFERNADGSASVRIFEG